MLPSNGMKARHGTNNYWINIDCLTDDLCGSDAMGGTPDGTGENGSGPDLGGPDSIPGETDPWPGWAEEDGDSGYWGTGGPAGGGSPWPGNGASGGYPWGPGNSGYNDGYYNGGTGSGSGGSGSGGSAGTGGSGGSGSGGTGGSGSGGTGGSGSGGTGGSVGSGGPGNPPGTTGGGSSTSPTGSGNYSDSYGCSELVVDQHLHLEEDPTYTERRSYYHTLPDVEGNVHIRWVSTEGTQRYRIYYGDELLHTTTQLPARDSGEIAPREVEYFFWPGRNGGDGKVRVEVEGSMNSIWLYKLYCPGDYFWDRIHPCGGVYSGGPYVTTTSTMVQDMFHDMGPTPGTIELLYLFPWVAAKCEVFHGGSLIASSPGFTETGTAASGYHHGLLEIPYDPANADGDTIVVVRITSTEVMQSWTYHLWCPHGGSGSGGSSGGGSGSGSDPYIGSGSESDPKTCGDEAGRVDSVGAPSTIMYHDLGSDGGEGKIRFNTFSSPDNVQVFQGGDLLQASGSVSGNGSLTFEYDPSSGDLIEVRVDGAEGEVSDWSYIMDCVEGVRDCSEEHQGTSAAATRIEFDGIAPDDSFSLTEYYTIAPSVAYPAGAPNRISIESDGTVLEDTVAEVYRWPAVGAGALITPTTGLQNVRVINDSASWWQFRTHCPTVHPNSGTRFTNFSKGLPKMVETSGPDANGFNGYQIALTSDTIVQGNRAFMAVSMFNTESGNIRIQGECDDFASVMVMPDGGPWLHVADLDMLDFTPTDVTISPGVHFLYVLCENIPHNTPSWLIMKITDIDTGEVISITSSDWRGAYFEPTVSLGSGNSVFMPEVEAYMFNSDTEAQSFIAANPAPTLQDVFNTWPRVDGDNYYASASSAGGEAADWYYDTSNNRFVMPTNTGSSNSIISPDAVADYELEAVLTSSNNDDDSIGLVVAAQVQGGVPYQLVVVRNKGGNAPSSGYGLLYLEGSSVTVLESWGGEGDDVSGGWSGARTKVRVRKNGDAFTVDTEKFNGGSFTARNFNINDYSETTRFSGDQRFGFYTRSQSESTYENVVWPFTAGRVFSASSGRAWIAESGSWVNQGTTRPFSDWLNWPRVAVNPNTNDRFYVYRKVTRPA